MAKARGASGKRAKTVGSGTTRRAPSAGRAPKRASRKAEDTAPPPLKAPPPTLPQATPPRTPASKRSRGRAANGRSPASERLTPPPTIARMTQLDWDERPAPAPPDRDGLVSRWAARGEELLRRLDAAGVARNEHRADLREGRFMWIEPSGRVSAEARLQVVCSWSRSTSTVAMGWADPMVRACAIARIEGMPAEQDDVDEEGAWRIAMEAAELSSADYLYRVPTPHAWYFVALFGLTFAPERDSWRPGTPVGLVMRGLAETRQAIASRAEPADVVRERLRGLGSALLHQADYAYRDTDWVARLSRTGRRMMHLAALVPRASFGAVAAGRSADEWVPHDLAVELTKALDLLEDEWDAFT